MSRVLVPYDGSELSTAALEFALEDAVETDATVVALYVVEPFPDHTDAALTDREGKWQDRVEERAEAVFEVIRTVADETVDDDVDLEMEWRYGSPRYKIIDALEGEDVDQVVMGSHGRDGIERLILGSVAEHVMRRADVPVTVVR
ncbi:universal stress protein [Natrialbaceae archaeon AArc-T1-2]|uniref:universal stress protein n=1 Tax=Natrialbaceae archaeon AArc-T1-2 TaxID=3053904 RepID=UPI00255B1116|nr:universal stress protein [Natrialbaceae archaeon AArc-T1-2]WIV67853.1 universal stress protein [Natrialbaceae archaeon AArc-T1-2]